MSINGANQLANVTITNTNGINLAFGTGTLSATLAQNLATAGTPQFAGLTLTGQETVAYGANGLLVGASADMNGHSFGLAVGSPASTGTWPFGIIAGGGTSGIPVFTVSITNAVKTRYNTLDDASGNMSTVGNLTLGNGKTLNCDNIVGASTDLRINPHATGGTLYLGHDLTTVLAVVGAGVTNTTFAVINTTNNLTNPMFKVSPTAVVTTLGATLDDAKGNATFNTSVTTPTVYPTSISWTPSSPYVRKTVYVQLFQTQMFNLGTPYTAVAAPGAGQAYLVLNMVYNYQFSTNPYTGGGIVYPYVGSISYTSGVPTSSTLGGQWSD